jgi:hypothetical protein
MDLLEVGVQAPRSVICGRHWKDGRAARKYVLRWPQAESTPPFLRYEVQRGPELWMCDECAEEAKEWSELKKEDY